MNFELCLSIKTWLNFISVRNQDCCPLMNHLFELIICHVCSQFCCYLFFGANGNPPNSVTMATSRVLFSFWKLCDFLIFNFTAFFFEGIKTVRSDQWGHDLCCLFLHLLLLYLPLLLILPFWLLFYIIFCTNEICHIQHCYTATRILYFYIVFAR